MNDTPPPMPSPTSSDEKLWIILSHLSLLFGFGFVLPLIVYLVKKQDSPLTADHAKEALNFHISVYLYGILSAMTCVGVVFIPVLAIAAAACAIIASIKASDGEFFRYPLTIRLV